MDEYAFRGAVAVSSNGSIGIISKSTEIRGQACYVGMSLSGRPWQSRQPRILAYSLSEFLANKIEDSITNERKSYLDSLRRVKRRNGNTEDKAIIGEVIECINERAAERREMRKIAPALTPERPQNQVTLVDTDEFAIQTPDSSSTFEGLRLWDEEEPLKFPQPIRMDDSVLELRLTA